MNKELKEKTIKWNAIFLILITIFSYEIYNKKTFDLLGFFIAFLSVVSFIFIINPFLEDKLQIRKLVNYNSRRELAFLKVIFILIYAPIIYFIYKYFNN